MQALLTRMQTCRCVDCIWLGCEFVMSADEHLCWPCVLQDVKLCSYRRRGRVCFGASMRCVQSCLRPPQRSRFFQDRSRHSQSRESRFQQKCCRPHFTTACTVVLCNSKKIHSEIRCVWIMLARPRGMRICLWVTYRAKVRKAEPSVSSERLTKELREAEVVPVKLGSALRILPACSRMYQGKEACDLVWALRRGVLSS